MGLAKKTAPISSVASICRDHAEGPFPYPELRRVANYTAPVSRKTRRQLVRHLSQPLELVLRAEPAIEQALRGPDPEYGCYLLYEMLLKVRASLRAADAAVEASERR